MKKYVAMVVAAGLVSGCVQPMEITSEPVRATVVPSVPKDRLTKNTSQMEVRAFKATEDGKTVEVAGAVCELVSDELRARVVTPQVVILPTFKQRESFPNKGVPGSLAVTCKGGNMTGQAIVTANEKQVATATGGGIAAAVITLAITAAVANSTPWQFPFAANVTMKE
jgi:hypothetical protein